MKDRTASYQRSTYRSLFTWPWIKITRYAIICRSVRTFSIQRPVCSGLFEDNDPIPCGWHLKYSLSKHSSQSLHRWDELSLILRVLSFKLTEKRWKPSNFIAGSKTVSLSDKGQLNEWAMMAESLVTLDHGVARLNRDPGRWEHRYRWARRSRRRYNKVEGRFPTRTGLSLMKSLGIMERFRLVETELDSFREAESFHSQGKSWMMQEWTGHCWCSLRKCRLASSGCNNADVRACGGSLRVLRAYDGLTTPSVRLYHFPPLRQT